MNVTLDESVKIYARATMKWFGVKAREKTRERIQQLIKAGDLEGAKIHEQVNECILHMERTIRA